MSNTQRSNAASRDSRLKDAIEKAVYHTIFNHPSFNIDVPKLSLDLWDRVSIITPANKEENERLEFLGDTLMDSSIAIDLYKAIPDGTPHKYTLLLNVLHANRTFCHLARRMKLENSGHDTKSVGDIFEVIIGAYYTEKGFGAVHAWASRVYEVLIHEASIAFDDCLREYNTPSAAAEDPTGSPRKGKGKPARRMSGAQRTPSFPTSAPQPRPGPSTLGRRRPSYSTATLADPSTPRVPATSSRPDVADHTHGYIPTSTRPTVPSSPNDSSRHSEHTTPRNPPRPLSDDEEAPLPEFWEKRLYDGKVLFVNHTTKTTTWEDPRHTHGPLLSDSEDGGDPDSSWRARLMTGDSYPSHDYDLAGMIASSEGGIEPFPELLVDGYEYDDRDSPRLTILPDFWEELQGQDGWTYYIDHANSKFMRKGY